MDTSKLIVINDADSFVTESYKLLRTNLNFKSSSKQNQVMLVTSSGKSEGKSTTIANLAASFAQAKKTVLLIDCDLRQPSLNKVFGLNRMKPGLTNVLVDKISLKAALNEVGNLGLYVMPAGSKKVSATELLNSDEFENLIESCRSEFDLILIDTPPVLSFADASIISRVADGVLVVASAGETKKSMILEVKKNLDKVGANLIGVILTKVEFKKNPNYYQYDEYNKKKKHRFV